MNSLVSNGTGSLGPGLLRPRSTRVTHGGGVWYSDVTLEVVTVTTFTVMIMKGVTYSGHSDTNCLSRV